MKPGDKVLVEAEMVGKNEQGNGARDMSWLAMLLALAATCFTVVACAIRSNYLLTVALVLAFWSSMAQLFATRRNP